MTVPESSISDQPISKDNPQEEALGTGDYAHAMADFILHCSTPLTIGIQGEWGSGKTSLMYLIREEITKNDIASAWLNTWEYAMFRPPEDVAPSVLRGMLEELEAHLKERDYKWPEAARMKMDKVKGALKTIGKIAFDVAVQQTTGKADASKGFEGASERLARTEIAEVRRQLAGIIEGIIEDGDNPYKKIVFFIDDLDRIEPPVAVSILESLKNIFDIRHCVFVLAIDYDIVVKGLQSKFGIKTEENEREFRSFFDKIIQVPFSMPVGAYNIEKLIDNLFVALGFEVEPSLISEYLETVSLTVGGNPRSIKRYFNTYSLLRRMRDLNDRNEETKPDAKDDFTLFFLIGVQIAYPRIYQLLLKDPDYPHWDQQFAERAGVSDKTPEQETKNELLDEPWEKIIWNACQRDSYLKARSLSVLNGLNLLRRIIGDDAISLAIERSMLITNITSVDDDQDAKHKKGQRVRMDSIAQFVSFQKDRGFRAQGLEIFQTIHKHIEDSCEAERFSMNIAPGQISYYYSGDQGRGRVFLYMAPAKTKGPRLRFTDTDEGVPVGSMSAFDANIRDRIAKSRDWAAGTAQ